MLSGIGIFPKTGIQLALQGMVMTIFFCVEGGRAKRSSS